MNVLESSDESLNIGYLACVCEGNLEPVGLVLYAQISNSRTVHINRRIVDIHL